MSNPPGPIATPPSTTLSTPSPTELHDTDPLSFNNEMPPSPSTHTLKHIYLIVATTPVTTPSGPRLGIGLKGSLPWPMIKPDMNFFRQVTTNGREKSPPSSSNSTARTLNSVFMGRKTYESIPSKFRPLSGRRSHIITRSDTFALAERYRDELVVQHKLTEDDFQIVRTATPLPRLEHVMIVRPAKDADTLVPITIVPSVTAAIDSTAWSPFVEQVVETGLLICIGGAEIYDLVLKDVNLRPRLRILQTEIRKMKEGEEFECDTFWPEDLQGVESGWREVSAGEVKGWTGIDVPQGEEEWKVVEGVGVRIRVKGWEPEAVGVE